ncbi:MAG: hypothetical protein U5R06_02230 [candidate division KSB1 bacterium]|nr:hypothetical protein [candidate division KSB1 bacterium]
MKPGDKILVFKLPADSHYLAVVGTITDIQGDRIWLQATRVKDRWSKKWKVHPTSCAMSTFKARCVPYSLTN